MLFNVKQERIDVDSFSSFNIETMFETMNGTVLFRIRHGMGNGESECMKGCLEGIFTECWCVWP